jgi:hypothetical protein
MKIYGAGMAGLLAGNMLRRWNPTLCEMQSALPDNHSALLRFRTADVSTATGIPFKRVKVLKAVYNYMKYELRNEATLRDNNEYSYKVTGEVVNRSVINLDPVERYIAPPGFISAMAEACHIEYSLPLTTPEECISTIPMPALMDIVGWADKPEFRYKPITTVNIELSGADVYQTVYFPSERQPYYRASVTGNLLTIEYPGHVEPYYSDYAEVKDILGLWSCHSSNPVIKWQKYGKLLPIDDRVRKAFILAMTDQYRIYSLGRFATWRQILMDDVVLDVRRIEIWLSDRNEYGRHLHYAEAK